MKKVCTKCLIEKDLEEFPKKKTSKDGRGSWCSECLNKYKREHRDRTADKAYRDKHKKEAHEYYENNKNRILENLTKPAEYDCYFEKLNKYDGCRRDPDNPKFLQVKCKNHNCGKWFNPTNREVRNRIRSINQSVERTHGECNFYCSAECKESCPLYNLKSDPNNRSKNNTSRDNLPDQLREFVLELDNYECQMCGAKEEDGATLECHHIVAYRLDKMLSADADNCITLCNKCHDEIHRMDGCTSHDIHIECLNRRNKNIK